MPLLRTESFPQHGAGVNIFTANVYLAEDRVRSKKKWAASVPFSLYPALDLVLGTGVEARRVVGTSLCQVSVRRHRYPGSGAVVTLGGVIGLRDVFRSMSWSRNAGGHSTARSSPHYVARSSSTTYTAHLTASPASSGYMSSSSIRLSTLSFPGSAS